MYHNCMATVVLLLLYQYRVTTICVTSGRFQIWVLHFSQHAPRPPPATMQADYQPTASDELDDVELDTPSSEDEARADVG